MTVTLAFLLGAAERWLEWRAPPPDWPRLSQREIVVGWEEGLLLLWGGRTVEAWDLEERRLHWSLPLSVLALEEGIIRPGERIRAVNGEYFPYSGRLYGRPGEEVELQIEGSGGRRRAPARLIDRAAVPTFEPKAVRRGPDWLMEDEVWTSCVDAATGAVRWRQAGGVWLAEEELPVVLGRYDLASNGVRLCVVEPDTGAVRWERLGAFGSVLWTGQGLLSAEFEEDRTVIRLLDPTSGEPLWDWTDAQMWSGGRLSVSGDRALVMLEAPGCASTSWINSGSLPTHFAPICERALMFGLSDGRVVWDDAIGGRAHVAMGGPFRGGQALFSGAYLAAYDPDGQRLTWMDPATARVEGEIEVSAFGFVEPQPGFDIGLITSDGDLSIRLRTGERQVVSRLEPAQAARIDDDRVLEWGEGFMRGVQAGRETWRRSWEVGEGRPLPDIWYETEAGLVVFWEEPAYCSVRVTLVRPEDGMDMAVFEFVYDDWIQSRFHGRFAVVRVAGGVDVYRW